MKRTILMLLAVVGVLSCAAQNTQDKDEAKQAASLRTAEQIADSVDNRTLSFTFDYVMPMRFPPHYLTSDYNVSIRGDSIESYLPYFGRAYRTNIANNDRSPLAFSATTKNFAVKKGRKGEYKISFRTYNESEQMDFYITLFDNGQATLNINSSDRETISFDGQMDIKNNDDER